MPRKPRVATGKRNAKQLEQFYSSGSIVKAMRDAVNKHMEKADIYVDPSCGDSSFLNACPAEALRIGFDIDPKPNKQVTGVKVTKCDFNEERAWKIITTIIRNFEKRQGRKPIVCVASNPPFKQLKKWFQRVSEIADWVLWLSPQQNMRFAYQNSIPSNFQLCWQQRMSNSTFTHQGEEVERPSVLQIWKRAEKPLNPLPDVAMEELGIADWRFAQWSEFNSKQHKYKLCMSKKTGQLWITNRLYSQSKRCSIQGDPRRYYEATSVCDLIVCRTKLARDRLLRINRIIQSFEMPSGCTRPTFQRREMAWLWLKRHDQKSWQKWSANTSIQYLLKSRKRIDISPLDKFLFKN